jgi:hypothetical protein
VQHRLLECPLPGHRIKKLIDELRVANRAQAACYHQLLCAGEILHVARDDLVRLRERAGEAARLNGDRDAGDDGLARVLEESDRKEPGELIALEIGICADEPSADVVGGRLSDDGTNHIGRKVLLRCQRVVLELLRPPRRPT